MCFITKAPGIGAFPEQTSQRSVSNVLSPLLTNPKSFRLLLICSARSVSYKGTKDIWIQQYIKTFTINNEIVIDWLIDWLIDPLKIHWRFTSIVSVSMLAVIGRRLADSSIVGARPLHVANAIVPLLVRWPSHSGVRMRETEWWQHQKGREKGGGPPTKREVVGTNARGGELLV